HAGNGGSRFHDIAPKRRQAPERAVRPTDSCADATRNNPQQFVMRKGVALRRKRVYRARLFNRNPNRRHRWISVSASPSLACAPGASPDGGFGSTFFLTKPSTVPIPPEVPLPNHQGIVPCLPGSRTRAFWPTP